MNIFGGVLDIAGAAADASDGLEFVINVLQSVTKFVGGPEDREIIQKFFDDIETIG